MNMPMNGMEIDGYDNAKKKFFSTWIDNMGTGFMYLEGQYDEPTQTITYTGTASDPMGKDYKVREIVKMIDDDNVYMEMFADQNGNEVKTMEVKSTRVKKSME